MRKFIDLCKKPLLIVTAALFLVVTVLLIVSCTTPLGKTYAWESSMKTDETAPSIDFRLELTLNNKEEYSTKLIVTNTEELVAESVKHGLDEAEARAFIQEFEKNMTTENQKYVLENGKYYMLYNDEKIEMGEKKGYKILYTSNAVNEEEAYLVCTVNKPMQITSIVLMVVFGLAAAGCVVVLVLDKTGKLSKKETPAAEETTSTTAAE